MSVHWEDRIVSTPEVLRGKPRIKNTRIPASLILGYLAAGSNFLYGSLGPTTSNILVGFASAIFDNIPVMFAVLEMSPEMSLGQWQLITLTAGVGGSMLAVGSAAGVAVMGQARGIYTFFNHLKWSWAIVIGYAASVFTHLLINGAAM